jgi:hypothetical protein
VAGLKNPPGHIIPLGSHLFKGQARTVDIHLIPSERLTQANLRALLDTLDAPNQGSLVLAKAA